MAENGMEALPRRLLISSILPRKLFPIRYGQAIILRAGRNQILFTEALQIRYTLMGQRLPLPIL